MLHWFYACLLCSRALCVWCYGGVFKQVNVDSGGIKFELQATQVHELYVTVGYVHVGHVTAVTDVTSVDTRI